jgi:hypothetical protein
MRRRSGGPTMRAMPLLLLCMVVALIFGIAVNSAQHALELHCYQRHLAE